jgi:spore coat polysaccharide biosynthesis protein SpsF
MTNRITIHTNRSRSTARADALIVLQARMGSSRLPGKVLAPLAGRTMLAHCVERLRAADVGEVLVATTERPDDDAVVAEAGRLGVRVVRGAVDDVLGRLGQAVANWNGPYVIRAAADNPMVDMDGARRLLRVLDEGADYCVEEGLPVGASVEAMRTDVLRKADRLATSSSDREHVTPFIRHRHEAFTVRLLQAPLALRRPVLRLTVDTRTDLQFVRGLLEPAEAGGRLLALSEIVALADRFSDWAGVA